MTDKEIEKEEETMNYIDRVGTELEGSFESEFTCTDPNCSHDHEWHQDSSVSVSGRDYNDCEDCNCADHCECDMWRRCSTCEERPEDCTCSECLWCNVCNTAVDDCECSMATEDCDECKRVNPPYGYGKKEDACHACYVRYKENHWTFNCHLTGNTSFHCEDPRECGCCSCSSSELIDRELVSPAMPRYRLAEWVKEHYPQEVNGTCSAHLHVSLNKIRWYSILMNREFTEKIASGLIAWGNEAKIVDSSNFWSRVNGKCDQWCAKLWKAYDQVNAQTKGGERYTMVNYCYRLRRTIEFRVAHIFKKAELTIKQHERILSLIDEYLTEKGDSLRTLHLGLDSNIGGEE